MSIQLRQYKHPILSETMIGLVANVLRSSLLSDFRGSPEGHLGGKNVQALEYAFCQYFGVKYAIAMNSATACLHSALVACGVGPGDEVIVSPYSFSSSASCVLMVGATPVFADIEPRMFCLAPQSISRAITPRTRVILPVHLCGHPAEMDTIMGIAKKHNLKVIEDAAQAIGAKFQGEYVGTIGDCGVFSFNQSKHISTGEGGMLITNDDYIARVARAMRNHGEVSDPELGIVGYNYRLCEMEAVLALEQFRELDRMTDYRIDLANYITEQLSRIDGLIPPVVRPACQHVYYTYPLRLNGLDKKDFCQRLADKGIYWGTYVEPLYLLPVYQKWNYGLGLCPTAERMYQDELVVTDIFRYPMTMADCDMVIKQIKEVVNELQR